MLTLSSDVTHCNELVFRLRADHHDSLWLLSLILLLIFFAAFRDFAAQLTDI